MAASMAPVPDLVNRTIVPCANKCFQIGEHLAVECAKVSGADGACLLPRLPIVQPARAELGLA